jgi:site-specific recombinase XerD
MKRKEYDRTVCEITAELNDLGYSIDVIDVFVGFARSLSKKFSDDEADVNIAVAGSEYIESQVGMVKADTIRHKKRQLRFITSYVDTGVVDVSYADRAHRESLDSCYDQLLKAYVDSLVTSGKKQSTTVKWEGYAYRFLKYLENQGVASINDLTAANVDEFIHWVSKIHMITGLDGELTMLRSLFLYTDDEGLTENAVWWVPKGRYLKPVPVPVYQDDELQQLFGAIDRKTAIGKRDFAIMLLALEMGLRASDVVALTLDAIDWDTAAVTICQVKTGKLLRLPMPQKVSASLADYILNARPECNHKEVFLVAKKPPQPFCKSPSLWAIVKKYCDKAGIERLSSEGQRIGLHRMRHTYATKMLNAGQTPAAIATALGHAKIENAQTYIRLDTETLRSCCLSLPKTR